MSTATLEQTAEVADWHAWRASGLGASDMAAVMGLSPHRTPLDVFMDKTGQGTPQPESLAMFLGKAAEPKIAADYELATGHSLIAQQVCKVSASRPYMRATLDAIRDDDMPVEFKLVLGRSTAEFGDEGTDELPDSFIIQGHCQLFVADADLMHFAVASPLWGPLRLYELRRNEALMRQILDAADAMWHRILARDPPPFSEASDCRHAPALFGDEGPTVDLGEAGAEMWAEYAGLGVVERDARKLRDEVKTKLFNALGPAAFGVLPDGSRVARKVVSRGGYSVNPATYSQLRLIQRGK